MSKRFVTIWFRHLKTDWFSRREPLLKSIPFVLASPIQGRMVITATNEEAERAGIFPGEVVADARAILPELKVYDDKSGLNEKLLNAFALYCIRFSPTVAIDLPGGIIIDASGCAHLWDGEETYLKDIIQRFKNYGYDVRAAMADTIGAAWAITHFGKDKMIVKPDEQRNALLTLSPAALRLEQDILELLFKLGLRRIHDFIGMPLPVLKRRFGPSFIQRLNQALGYEAEFIQPLHQPPHYTERLVCHELIITATGIEIALDRLLKALCSRLQREQKGIRTASFKCYRIDGKIQQLTIGTNFPSHNSGHLIRLFAIKLDTLEPGLGFELFTIEAEKVEELLPMQEKLWVNSSGIYDVRFSELIDRITNRIGQGHIHRFLPAEHYWPERSIQEASSFDEKPETTWRTDKPRPTQLLSKPERIEVTAPIPDYPPMLFRYKGQLHTIRKADGPERIEREWWLDSGQHRDYYTVEDEEGSRYWLFRSGHYLHDQRPEWFIHGFFA